MCAVEVSAARTKGIQAALSADPIVGSFLGTSKATLNIFEAKSYNV
jgi:hypothetical protein